MTPPIPLHEAYKRVYSSISLLGEGDKEALNTLGRLGAHMPEWMVKHRSMEHTVPSPSNLTECIYKLWCRSKNFEPDQETPMGWKLRSAMGIISEPYFLSLLEISGFEVDVANTSFSCGPNMQAHVDAVINKEFIYEGKSESGFGYKKLLESKGGVRTEEKGHYMQAQMYMYATDMEWVLYLSAPPDFGMLQSLMRQKKQYGARYELQPLYLEWILRDEVVIEEGLRRAEKIVKNNKSDTPPMREYDGQEFTITGRRSYPCGYCLYLDRCHKTFDEVQ